MAKNILLRFISETSGLERGFRRAQETATGFSGKLGQTAQSLGNFRTAIQGVVAGAIASWITSMGRAGAELDLLRQKVEVVFGSQVGRIREWANENAAALGMTQNEAAGVAAGLQDLLVPMGFTRQGAADITLQLLDLVGALTLWDTQGRSSAEISRILAAALTGERESLKSLGIVINEADISAALLARGQKDLTGTALEQAKAQATLDIILRKSRDAQAAYGSDAAEASKKQNRATAQIKEAKEELTGFFKEVVGAGAGAVMRTANDVKWLGDRVEDVTGAFRDSKPAKEADTAATKAHAEAVLLDVQAVDVNVEALEAARAAARAHEQATRSLRNAQEGRVEAQEALNELLAAGAVDEKDVARATEALATAQERVRDATDRVTEAQEALNEARARATAEEISDAELGVEEAHNRVARASARLEDANRDLYDALHPVAATMVELAGAEADVEDRTAKLARAQNDLIEAEQTLAGLRAHGGLVSAKDLKDAELDLEEAQADVTSAQADLLEAGEDLNDTRQQGTVDAQKVKQAEQGIKDAQLELKQATDAVENAESNLQETHQKGAEESEGVKAAKERLRDANKELAGATKDVGDREGELRAARAGDPAFEDRVTDARRRLRDATEGVRDAEWQMRDAVVARDAAMKAAQPSLDAAWTSLLGISQVDLSRLRRDTGNILSSVTGFQGAVGPPPSGLASAPVNITVNGFVGNDQDLARRIDQILGDYRRRNGG